MEVQEHPPSLIIGLKTVLKLVLYQVCLRYYEHEFVELACQCPAVVCCRCSPTQKAQIVTLLQQHTANRTCAIGEPADPGGVSCSNGILRRSSVFTGDGGNDVSMIQAADCGIGIEGKVGGQIIGCQSWNSGGSRPSTAARFAGGEAGVAGCRLLHHTVQACGPPAHGSRQEQLQALGGARPVRHAPRDDHLHHAGEVLFQSGG